MKFLAYGVKVEGKIFATFAESMKFLESLGFEVVPYTVCNNLEEVIAAVEKVGTGRETSDHLEDGAVIRVNDNEVFENMGYTSHHPKGATAFKFEAEKMETKMYAVEWTRGKKGKLSPNARLETILLAGTNVSNALLHTMKKIDELGVMIGDTVVVEKAAEIIPQVVGVRADLRDGSERPILAPDKCPICQTATEMRGEYYYCVNADCGDTSKNKLLTYVDHIGLKGIGPKAAEKLAENAAFQVASDLYKLTEENFVAAGVAPKNATKLVEAIKNSIGNNKPKEVLAGLSIDTVGRGTSEDLVEVAGLKIKDLCNKPRDYFIAVKNIGPTTADALTSWFNNPQNVALVEELYQLGVIKDELTNRSLREPSMTEKLVMGKLVQSPLRGLTICITGALSQPRSHFEDLIASNGGKFTNTYKKSIDVLIVGGEAQKNSKYKKAQQDGVTVWSEEDFWNKVG